MSSKSNFTAEVDNLLLGNGDVKAFYRSRVEFTNTLNMVMKNV